MASMTPSEDTGAPLERLAWAATVAICLIAALLVLLSGYVGYSAVLVAIAGSAAINVR